MDWKKVKLLLAGQKKEQREKRLKRTQGHLSAEAAACAEHNHPMKLNQQRKPERTLTWESTAPVEDPTIDKGDPTPAIELLKELDTEAEKKADTELEADLRKDVE